MRKTKIILTHDNRSLEWDLNLELPKYETRMLATAPRFSWRKSRKAEMRGSERNCKSLISRHCFDPGLRCSKLELTVSQNHCCDTLGRFSLAQNEQQYSNSMPTTGFHLYPVLSTAVSDFTYPQFLFMYTGQNSWCSHQDGYICWWKSCNGVRNQFYRFQITISGRALCDHYLTVHRMHNLDLNMDHVWYVSWRNRQISWGFITVNNGRSSLNP
jgi:hypothetical protein